MFSWRRKAPRERRRRKHLGGSGGMLPQEIFKIEYSETPFTVVKKKSPILISKYRTWNGKRPDETSGLRPQMKTLPQPYFFVSFQSWLLSLLSILFEITRHDCVLVNRGEPNLLPFDQKLAEKHMCTM